MKKTYVLNVEGKNRDRLLDASKHDIRKYVKRERARALPTGVDFWDFDCKLGMTDAVSTPVHLAALIAAVDALVKDGSESFYVEVVTKNGYRLARPTTESLAESLEQSLGD